MQVYNLGHNYCPAKCVIVTALYVSECIRRNIQQEFCSRFAAILHHHVSNEANLAAQSSCWPAHLVFRVNICILNYANKEEGGCGIHKNQ